jgi:hypothetical protein
MMSRRERRERVFLDDADCCLFTPSGSANGSRWGPENRPIGSALNTEKQNVDMLGTDPSMSICDNCIAKVESREISFEEAVELGLAKGGGVELPGSARKVRFSVEME